MAAAGSLPIPPEELSRFVGAGDFEAIGAEFLRYFVDLGGLRPEARVLDVGCGIGRMARPLTQYLNSRGSYFGFDVVPDAIAWCQQHMTPRYPNFVFAVADVHNRFYNPSGRGSPDDYRFPLPDRSFDFVFATSVFTHTLPATTRQYLREIARVMRPGATCLATFFLLNEESTALVRAGRSSQPFVFPHGECLTTDQAVPERSIAYPEPTIRATLAEHRLAVQEPLHYGAWCGRSRFLSYQDVVIARR